MAAVGWTFRADRSRSITMCGDGLRSVRFRRVRFGWSCAMRLYLHRLLTTTLASWRCKPGMYRNEILVSLLLLLPVGFTAAAQSPVAAADQLPAKRQGAVTIDKIQIEIPDLLVVDQDGIRRRFYSDLIKDKVVILSFFFTSCQSTCPAMNARLKK